MQSISVGVNTI